MALSLSVRPGLTPHDLRRLTSRLTQPEAVARYRVHLWLRIRAGEVTLEELAELDGCWLACWCSGAIDARDFVRARKDRATMAHLPQGTARGRRRLSIRHPVHDVRGLPRPRSPRCGRCRNAPAPHGDPPYLVRLP